jgi:hypothetical protein
MAKIYNIHSNSISQEDLESIQESISAGKDIYMLNEDIRYEVIDLEKMSVMRSKNFSKGIYAIYLFIARIKCIFKIFGIFGWIKKKLKRSKK